MIAAAIDIGTNSVKLVVGEKTSDGVRTLFDGVKVTRLGQGVDAAKTLHPDAVERTLAALRELAEIAKSHGAEKIAAVGTSALRDASDGPVFAARASELLGGPVEIIAGEREAELTFAAVVRDPDLKISGPVIATDIGGGSAEVVLGDASGILFETSLQLGAVRLTERVKPSDPWTPADLARAEELVDEALSPLPTSPTPTPPSFVACGGTAASLAGMTLARQSKPASVDTIHGVALHEHTLTYWIETLAARTVAERKNVPGLEPARAEVIVAGAVIQRALLRRFGLISLIVSARGLRYGLLYALLENT